MASLGETYTVILNVITKGQQSINAVTNSVKNMTRSVNSFGRVMRQDFESWQMFNKLGIYAQNFIPLGARVANRLRMMTHGMRGFRMELLAVMFFGMALQRTFQGLLQPAAEAFGIMELWGVMLQILFLPIISAIYPYLLAFMLFFMDLPKGAQMAIGIFVLLGLIIGTLLFLVGQFLLGIGGIILFFSGFGGIPALITPIVAILQQVAYVVGYLVGAFTAVFAAIAVIIIGFIWAWRDNFGQIKEWVEVIWEGVKQVFSAALDFIDGLWKLFVSILKLDFQGAWDAIKQIFGAAGDFFLGVIDVVVGILATLGLSVWRVLTGLWSWFYRAGMKIGSWIFNGIKNALPPWLVKIIEGVGGSISRTVSAIKDFRWGKEDDFIWRPGQAPVSINPNDTLVGTKGGMPGGQSVYSPVYNITISDKRELERMLESHDKRAFEEMKRMFRVTA